MRPIYYTLDENHDPVPTDDILVWGRFFEDRFLDRLVAQETIGSTFLSTVFLGIDHNWGVGRPILFETMAFPIPAPGQFASQEAEVVERWSTWAEAEAGHKMLASSMRHDLMAASN